jgi:hypothetical protein
VNARLGPAPKGYRCAAGCGHSVNVHREGGCDAAHFDGTANVICCCEAPYGRIPPGDSDPQPAAPRDVPAAVLAEVEKLHELVALYMPQFGTVRSDAFTRLDRIAALMRGEHR